MSALSSVRVPAEEKPKLQASLSCVEETVSKGPFYRLTQGPNPSRTATPSGLNQLKPVQDSAQVSVCERAEHPP